MPPRNMNLAEVRASANKVPAYVQKHVTVLDSADDPHTAISLIRKPIIVNRFEGSMDNLTASAPLSSIGKNGQIFTFKSDPNTAPPENRISPETRAIMTGEVNAGSSGSAGHSIDPSGVAAVRERSDTPIQVAPDKSLEVTLKIVDSFGISTKCRDAFLSDDEKHVILIFKPGEFQIDLGSDPDTNVVLLVEGLPCIYKIAPHFVKFVRNGDEYCIYEILLAKPLA
jgi:hypothetical protein